MMRVGFFVAILSLCLGIVPSHAEDGSFLRYTVPSTITLGEPIVAVLTIENNSENSMAWDLGFDRVENFRLEPRPGTQLQRQPPDGGPGGISRGGQITVLPGQVYQQRLLLNDWFLFERVGLYEIDIRLDERPADNIRDARAGTLRDATTLRFRILPKNERVLRETCARLSAIISTERDVATFQQGARELVAVNDPVAVPYIAQALAATDWADPILIEGLRKDGGIAAKALIEQLARDGKTERVALARDALRRLR